MNTVSAFQERVVKPFLEALMLHTTKGVSWNFQGVALEKGMLFLSNHRDIVLDPSLVNVALMDHGREATEIGIGSNLLGSPWVRQLVKLNRCFVVERSGSARERYNHSLDTAAYIQGAIRSGNARLACTSRGSLERWSRCHSTSVDQNLVVQWRCVHVECAEGGAGFNQLRMGSVRCPQSQ